MYIHKLYFFSEGDEYSRNRLWSFHHDVSFQIIMMLSKNHWTSKRSWTELKMAKWVAHISFHMNHVQCKMQFRSLVDGCAVMVARWSFCVHLIGCIRKYILESAICNCSLSFSSLRAIEKRWTDRWINSTWFSNFLR